MTTDQPNTNALSKLQRVALLVGGVGIALCVLGAVVDLPQMLQSYLFGFVVCWSAAVGCLGITMITHLVKSNWGRASRPYFAAGIATLPLLAALFVPVALGVSKIYVWADPDSVAHDHLLEHKAAYLNANFFAIRAAAYFLVWVGLGLFLGRRSVVHRAQVSGEGATASRVVSGLGLGVLCMTVTFASIDWIMSLEPAWYSTIFGALIGAAGVVAAMSLAILAMGKFGVEFTGVNKPKTNMIADLGSLLLGFVLIWTYFAFSQYLIIWSGDQPTESFWYLKRIRNGWEAIALLIVAFHFVIPFLLLLSRERKRNVGLMSKIVVMMLAIHAIDLFWNIKPAFSESLSVHWLDVAALAGIGGLWIACGAWQLRRQLTPATLASDG